MKTKLIQIPYHLTAFLADKTQGLSLFVKWKITFGSLLIGLSVVSCKQKSIDPAQQSLESKKDTIAETTCYKPAIQEEDTLPQKKLKIGQKLKDLSFNSNKF